MLEKSVVHYGVWNQEIKNSMQIYPKSLGGKKYHLWNLLLFFNQEAQWKGCSEEREGIFSLYGMSAIQFGT